MSGKVKLIAAVLIVIAAGVGLAYGPAAFKSDADAPPERATATLPENYLAPSETWLRDYRQHQRLEKEITVTDERIQKLDVVREQQERRDRYNGLGVRLVRAIPCFYRWDDAAVGFAPVAPGMERRPQCAGQQPPAASQALVPQPEAPKQ